MKTLIFLHLRVRVRWRWQLRRDTLVYCSCCYSMELTPCSRIIMDVIHTGWRSGRNIGIGVLLQLLQQHGADPVQQDHHGRDPYRVALR
jgi:hypothetical protein